MNTDELIRALGQDLTVRWPLGRAFALATIGGAAVAAALFVAAIGPRPDIAHALSTFRFPFKFVVTLSLAIPALGLMDRLARPGAPLGAWRWTIALAPALLAIGVFGELMVVADADWGTRLIGSNAPYCVSLIPLMAMPPLVGLVAALRYGAPTRPGLAGAVAGLAASGIAATFYASHCPDDSPLFVATWYTIATGIVVLVGFLAGRRLLRW